jgi:tRNA-binding EMAP/Myf-like protein
MKVGKIVKVEPHPTASQLYVEEIDLGTSKI